MGNPEQFLAAIVQRSARAIIGPVDFVTHQQATKLEIDVRLFHAILKRMPERIDDMIVGGKEIVPPVGGIGRRRKRI